MLKPLVLAACLMSPMAAYADQAGVLAEYWTNNGSLPPEYAWETSVTIHVDGKLVLQRCKGYATEGPGCKTRRATVKEADLQTIRDAARASGLLDDPAEGAVDVMVGGGVTGGVVYLDGLKISLLSQPAVDDAERVGSVLRAIRAVVPARFGRFFADD